MSQKSRIIAFFILLVFLVGCAQTIQPQPTEPTPERKGIPQIEVVLPQKVLPDKPEYEPPPTEPMPTQTAPTQTTSVHEITIEADDYGFYPSGDITVKKGDRVKIIFTIRTKEVYYGGLQIKSDSLGIFDTGSLKPGDHAPVEFTADNTFTYSSWWPSLARKKKTATVTVT